MNAQLKATMLKAAKDQKQMYVIALMNGPVCEETGQKLPSPARTFLQQQLIQCMDDIISLEAK